MKDKTSPKLHTAIWPLIPILLVLGLVFVYGFLQIRVNYGTIVSENSSTSFTDSLVEGQVLEDSFTLTEDATIRDLEFLFVNYGNVNQTGEINFIYTDASTEDLLATGAIDVSKISEWAYISTNLSNDIQAKAGQEIKIQIEVTELSDDATLSFVFGHGSSMLALRMKSNLWDAFQKFYLVATILMLVLVALSYVVIFIYKKTSYRIAVAVFSVLSMFLVNALLPAGIGLDERVHLGLAQKQAEQIAGLEADSVGKALITVDEAEAEFVMDAPNHEAYNRYFAMMTEGATDQSLVETDVTIQTESPDALYDFAALGILLGRALHLSARGVMFLARIFNMIPYLLLLCYAIYRVPFGKHLFIAIGQIPMFLQVTGTINTDGITLGLSWVILALVLQVMYGEDRGRLRFVDYGILAFASFLLVRCKYGALSPSVLLLLLIFLKFFRSKDREEKMVAWGALLVVLISFLAGFLPFFLGVQGTFGVEGGHWSNFYSMSYVLSHPKEMVYIFLNTLFVNGDMYYLTMFGTYFGAMNLLVPQYICILSFLLVMLSILIVEKDEIQLSPWVRIALLLAAVLGIGLSFGGMLIGYTMQGSDTIAGVQGRYFYPFLPMIAFALRPNRVRIPDAEQADLLRRKVMFSGICLQVLTVVALFLRA